MTVYACVHVSFHRLVEQFVILLYTLRQDLVMNMWGWGPSVVSDEGGCQSFLEARGVCSCSFVLAEMLS